MFSQPIAAMKPGSTLIFAQQWFGGAGVNRDIGATEFNCVERVAGRLLNLDIAGYGGDRGDADVGSTKSHDESDGIVGGGVGINEECARHARSIINEVAGWN